MIDPKTGGAHTYHTTNPVPFVLVTDAIKCACSRRCAPATLPDHARHPRPNLNRRYEWRDLRIIK